MKIVVTAPTGAIGRQVLQRLVASGAEVRAIARKPASIVPSLRERIEVIEGSHGDADVIDRALVGADVLFWLAPPNFRAARLEDVYEDFTRPACAAIARHAVARVVSISALGRGTAVADRAGFVTASLAMDELLANTGAAFRALTLPSFMDNLLRQLEPIRTQGVFFGQIDGSRKLPLCASRDIADAAARLLLDDTWTGRGHVAVLGPEDLSHDEMARILSDTLGVPVRYQQLPLELSKAGFIKAGMSEVMAAGRIEMMWAKSRGLDNGEPRTAQNSTPTSFREWCVSVLRPALLEARVT
ncbi:NmrA family transcriptional regulator [bacterium]|nr:MAG: NmrA family transcriptional regulator [bacterium]